MVVLIVMSILFLYFQGKEKREIIVDQNTAILEKEPVSGYEQFCQNNQDIDCGAISNFTAESAPQSKVILMDTDELDDDLRTQISQIANKGYDTSLVLEKDMHTLLDQLYEEELPDDIIDETIIIKKGKLKNFNLVPSHKPPYWGTVPKIVIIIDDMGISAKRTADISGLSYPLTVAFLSYGKNLTSQMEKSYQSGQEVMLHTPMEAFSKVEEAPDVLTTKMSLAEIRDNFEAMLNKFPSVRGVNNHMGSKLTEDIDRMKVIMEVLKERNMYFLDSKTSSKSRAEEAASSVGIAYAHRHVFLDNNNDKAYVLGQLRQVERLAKKNGYAIAIGHPKSQTYEALKEWLPQIQAKGFELIHLSDAIKVLNPQFSTKE